MKKIIGLVIGVLVLSTVWAQDGERENEELKTIFNDEVKATGFGAFDMIFTGMNDGYALLLGGHGGLIFNKRIMLGFGGYGIATPVSFDGIDPNERLELSGGYGGFVLGYVMKPREVFHASFPLTIGVGGMEVREKDFDFNPDDPFFDSRIENSIFVVVEPGVQLEVNITRFFRLGVGLSYRITEGIDLEMNKITDKDISGMSGNLSFKFGGF